MTVTPNAVWMECAVAAQPRCAASQSASVSLTVRMSTAFRASSGSAAAGAKFRIILDRRARARRMSAAVCSAGTSIWRTNVVSGVSSASSIWVCTANRLAPEPTAMAFFPSGSTAIAAQPVVVSVVATRVRSTLANCNSFSASAASASRPTAPAMMTRAPSRAAATAWLAPLPPGSMRVVGPRTVSPGAGMCGRAKMRSRLMEPKTTIMRRRVRSAPRRGRCRRGRRAGWRCATASALDRRRIEFALLS